MPLRYNWPDAKLLRAYTSGKSCNEIAESGLVVKDQFGRPHSPTVGGIRKRLIALGCEMRSSGVRGPKNKSWKGGRRVVDGYVWLRMPDHHLAQKNGYVAEHRLIAEQVLGRRLKPEEVVHHDDDDKQNNRPTNLVVYPDNATHMRETRKGIKPNWTPEGLARIAAAREQRVARCRAARAERERTQRPPLSAGIRLG